MADKKIKINCAPVMTLWATVVAERLGYNQEEALTLGKAVTGLNAQSKGQRLGIYEPGKEQEERARERQPGEIFMVQLLGRPVPVVREDGGIRAMVKDKPINPKSVQHYLDTKFGQALPAVRTAMEDLADSFSPEALAARSYALYEKFRPEIPEGVKGWGAAGELDLEKIHALKKQAS